ncbi:hypothetical protein [Novipirellula rosea]|uniref:Leucine Rich repeats (2 copies) n=1 Tax=Novipirellula rosea TaxID=1031540 RepID=A0ABP8NLH4_9BACT
MVVFERRLTSVVASGMFVLLLLETFCTDLVNSLPGQEIKPPSTQNVGDGDEQSSKPNETNERAMVENAILRAGGYVLKLDPTDPERITRVEFSGSAFADKSLEEIADTIQNVESVYLYGTSVTDRGLNSLGQLKNLKELGIESLTKEGEWTEQSSLLNGSGLEYLVMHRQNLETLELRLSSVDDKAIEHITKFTKLKTLRLDRSAISRHGFEQLRKTLPNTVIYQPLKPVWSDKQKKEWKKRHAKWLARVKKVSREEILAFGFRDFKRSEFEGIGYIPNIPFGDDQKGFYVERWYCVDDRPLLELLDFFGLVSDDIQHLPSSPMSIIPGVPVPVDRGRVFIDDPIIRDDRLTIKKAWLQRWILKDQVEE